MGPHQTWEQFLDVGKKVKDLGYPIGQSLGHSFGDPPSFCYTFLWSFGGSLVDENSKVAINSQATRDSIKFLTEFWKAACDDGGLAWDDTSNNHAFLGETIACTLNGASIYFVAKRNWDKKQNPFVWRLHHFLSPAGPNGSVPYHRRSKQLYYDALLRCNRRQKTTFGSSTRTPTSKNSSSLTMATSRVSYRSGRITKCGRRTPL